jgi:hypothetical protein
MLLVLVARAGAARRSALVPQIYFTTGVGLADGRSRLWRAEQRERPLQALMLQLFFASLGLVLALINGFMLYLVSWIFPNRFAVDSIFWALVGGILVVLLGSFLEGLFGLTRPIAPESEAELRQRLKAQDRSLVYTFLRPHPVALASEDAVTAVAGLPSGVAAQEETPPAVVEKPSAGLASGATAAGPEQVVSDVAAAEEAGT